MHLAILSGESVIAVSFDGKIYLLPPNPEREGPGLDLNQYREFPLDSDDEEEHVVLESKVDLGQYQEFPATPEECFISEGKVFRSLTFTSAYTSHRPRFGLFRDGKFYMKEIRIVEVDLVEVICAFAKATQLKITYNGASTVNYRSYSEELIEKEQLFRRDHFFLLKRVRSFLSCSAKFDRLDCPSPVMTETLAICTDKGAVCVFDHKGEPYFGAEESSFRLRSRIDDVYFDGADSLCCDHEVSFDCMDQAVVDKFWEQYGGQIPPDKVPPCPRTLVVPFGATGWLVFDFDKRVVKFPEFFLEKVQIIESNGLGWVYYVLGGVIRMIFVDIKNESISNKIVRNFFEVNLPVQIGEEDKAVGSISREF
jgi:hypothetical protein